MCKEAAPTISAVLVDIRPTIVDVETILGVVNTPDGQASMVAYDAIAADFANWVPGTSAQTVIQAIQDFTSGFNAVVAAIPVVPPEVAAMIDTISAGLVIVIGLLSGNATTDSAEQDKIIADTYAKVRAIKPGFKESLWDKGRAALGDHMVVANKYKKYWNQDVAAAIKVDPRYAAYKLA
jgi:hypothetical protein